MSRAKSSASGSAPTPVAQEPLSVVDFLADESERRVALEVLFSRAQQVCDVAEALQDSPDDELMKQVLNGAFELLLADHQKVHVLHNLSLQHQKKD